jgi:hypothetical protein
MFESQLVQGRWLSGEDVEVIRGLIGGHPHWSRRQISIAVSEAFNWRTASGQLKDMSARLLLAKLAERGVIELPPRQRRGGRKNLRLLSEPDLFWTLGTEQAPLEEATGAVTATGSSAGRAQNPSSRRFCVASSPASLSGLWRCIGARTCATSSAIVINVSWRAYFLAARPGKSKHGIASLAGILSSGRAALGLLPTTAVF